MTKSFDRRSRSLWMDIDVAPDAHDLEGNRSCDTIVIGSGIAGMSTAYELAMEGQKVIVVDRGRSPAASRHEHRRIWRRFVMT